MAALEGNAQIHEAGGACQDFVGALFEEVKRCRSLLGFIDDDDRGRKLGFGHQLKKAQGGRQLEFTSGRVQIEKNRVYRADRIRVNRKTAATLDVKATAEEANQCFGEIRVFANE